MSMTQPAIPAGYDAYKCRPCQGTGEQYDPTMADKVCSGTGLSKCCSCNGVGAIYILAGRPPHWAYCGERI